MFVQITEQYLLGLKQELALLKRADELIDEVTQDERKQIDMHNLLGGGIAILQHIIDACEKQKGHA